MERQLNELHAKALQLVETVSTVELKGQRIRGAKRFKDITLHEVSSSLRDFQSLSGSNTFSEKEISEMLGNSCLEMSSFLFSAGAPTNVWREWCSLAGMSLYLGQDFSYAMQLLTISRTEIDDAVSAALKSAELKSYREQAVQFVIFRSQGNRPPLLSPVHPLDHYYKSLVDSLESENRRGLLHAIAEIVAFWRKETSYGRFELGVFPVFEPEINSTVAALVTQGFELTFQEARVTDFLRAALE